MWKIKCHKRGKWDKREVKLETRQEKKTTQASQHNAGRGDQRRTGAKLLTEAEEERIHTHGVHAEEAMGDEVGSHDHRLQRSTHKTFYVIPESILSDC